MCALKSESFQIDNVFDSAIGTSISTSVNSYKRVGKAIFSFPAPPKAARPARHGSAVLVPTSETARQLPRDHLAYVREHCEVRFLIFYLILSIIILILIIYNVLLMFCVICID